MQHIVNAQVAPCANDYALRMCKKLQMAQVAKIHSAKTPQRIHYIVEWAKKRGVKQADIVRAIDADKGLVSRWFKGALPSEKHLVPLAGYLGADEPADLFRHPDEDWLKRLFAGRSKEERETMLRTLEVAFPRKQTA